MVRVPRVSDTGAVGGRLQAGRVVPFQDQTGQQLQQLGDAVSRTGAAALRVGLHQQDEARAYEAGESRARSDAALQNYVRAVSGAKVAGADAQLSEALRGVWGEVSGKIGGDAVDGHKAALTALEEKQRAIGETLESPEQREAFGRMAAARVRLMAGRVDAHVKEQAKAYEIGERTARAEASLQDYVVFMGQPEAAAHRGAMLAEVERLADVSNLPQDSAQRAELRQKALTKMHLTAVESMLQGGAGGAAAYLEQHAGEIEAGKLADARRIVGRATVAERSTQLALELAERPVPAEQAERLGVEVPRADMSPGERMRAEERGRLQRLELAGEELDRRFASGEITAEIRDATLDRLGSDFSRRQRLVAERGRQILTEAEQWLVANPTAAVGDLPPLLADQVDGLGLSGDLRQFAASGRRYVTDPQAFVEARAIPERALAKASEAELFVAWRGKLSNADFEDLLARRARAVGGGDSKAMWLLTKNERIERAARNPLLGKLPADPNTKASREQQEAFDSWRMELEGVLRAAGVKDGDMDGLQRVIDSVMADKVRVDPGMFSREREVALMSIPGSSRNPLDAAAAGGAFVNVGGRQVNIRDIPRSDWDAISAFLVSKGQAPTAAAVADYWLATKPGGAAPAKVPARAPAPVVWPQPDGKAARYYTPSIPMGGQ